MPDLFWHIIHFLSWLTIIIAIVSLDRRIWRLEEATPDDTETSPDE